MEINQNSNENTMRPNVVYILADDMGYGDVSYLNENAAFQTPNFDRICREGIVFTDAHASSAVCTPSRYSILTGRYSWRSRLKAYVTGGYSKPIIESGRMTVASMLQQSGYKTACIGKWHLGMEWEMQGEEADQFKATEGVNYSAPIKNGPITNGFDYFYGISASLDMPPYVYIENDKVTQIPTEITENTGKRLWRKGPTSPDFIHEEVLPSLAQKVMDKISEYQNDPFFIYFPMPAPHSPILPSEKFVGKSNTNEYGDFVLMCDDVVGQIVKHIEELNLVDNTIIIYTSDNGCSPIVDLPELIAAGHNPSYVFRGHKADIYEGGHRIPLLIQWKNVINPGSRSNEPVCLVDLMATMADLIGVNLPDNSAEDSVSNLPIWQGIDYQKPIREAIVHHSVHGDFSVRAGKWKLELCPGSGGWSYPNPGETPPNSPPIQLYDLENDISEKMNVWDKHPAMVSKLRLLLIEYINNGRSTKGVSQENTGGNMWEQLESVF